MNKKSNSSLSTRIHKSKCLAIYCMVACFLSTSTGLGYAAPAPLADGELFTPISVPPNILFTLDNSGSMAGGHPVDTEVGRAYNGTYTNELNVNVGGSVWHTRGERCYSHVAFNPLAYDPTITYSPPYVAILATGVDSQLPASTPSNAPMNGYAAYYGISDTGENAYVNLTTNGTKNNYNVTAWGWDKNTSANSTIYYPFYYAYTGIGTPTPGQCYSDANYTLKEIKPPATNTYPRAATRSDCTGAIGASGCSYAQELQNFANWFSYYRIRSNVVKGGVGEAAKTLVATSRVGFQTIDGVTRTDQYGGFLPVGPFTGSQKGEWYRKLYIQFPNWGTLLQRATSRAGEYFRVARQPGTSTTIADPILPKGSPTFGECQQNYHILSTDGYWNPGDQASAPAGNADYDTNIPNNTALIDVLKKETGINTLVAGQKWPAPYRLGTNGDGVGSTLADVAMYYWMTDLRTGSGWDNNIEPNARDGATWQHMVQFGVAFGAKGVAPFVDVLPAGPPPGDGNADSLPATWAYSSGGTETWKIDDMWHASVNGHGSFFNVNSFSKLVQAMGNVFADIGSRGAANAAPAASGGNLRLSADALVFAASYGTGWAGNLKAYAVNRTSGVVDTNPTWESAVRMATQFAGTGWSNDRRVVVGKGSGVAPNAAVAFRQLSALSAAQKTALDNSQNLLDYLRGDKINEDTASVTKTYRRRLSPLGDILNSAPVYVGRPEVDFSESKNPGFTAYKKKWVQDSPRAPIVYVGANDGMLHAINATNDGNGGTERWAYIPSQIFRNDATGIKALSWRESDPLPNKFNHKMLVDGDPVVADVDFTLTASATGGTPDWRALLVSGLRKGGKGYFAIDVTDPNSMSSESQVASKVLWEFMDDPAYPGALGYSYGKPAIFKVKGLGWVVAVSSGYNNTDPNGRGFVWLLNPNNGQILYRFIFANVGGASADPLNLGSLSALYPAGDDATADRLLATDLKGNVWRQDLTATLTGTEKIVSIPRAQFPGKSITTMVNGGGVTGTRDAWLVVGTGRLLDGSDLSATTANSLYAFMDGKIGAPGSFSTPTTEADLKLVSATTSTDSAFTAGQIGWKMPLSTSPLEHIKATPEIYGDQILVLATYKDNNNCSPKFKSALYVRNMDTGINKLYMNTGMVDSAGRKELGDVSDISISKTASGITITGNSGVGAVKIDLPKSSSSSTGGIGSQGTGFRLITD